MYPLLTVVLAAGGGLVLGGVIVFTAALIAGHEHTERGGDLAVIGNKERQAELVLAITRYAHQDVLGHADITAQIEHSLTGLTTPEQVQAFLLASGTALQHGRDYYAATAGRSAQEIAANMVETATFNTIEAMEAASEAVDRT